jgi:hypothetical protein
LLGVAALLRLILGAPLRRAKQAQYERAMVNIRTTLGEQRVAALRTATATLPLEQIIGETTA